MVPSTVINIPLAFFPLILGFVVAHREFILEEACARRFPRSAVLLQLLFITPDFPNTLLDVLVFLALLCVSIHEHLFCRSERALFEQQVASEWCTDQFRHATLPQVDCR